MRKYVIAWTFSRHIHRQREYKILQKVFEVDASITNQLDFVGHYMNSDADVQALYKKGFKRKMEAVTDITSVQIVKPITCDVCDHEPAGECEHPKNAYCAKFQR